jgi:hypothetical protein
VIPKDLDQIKEETLTELRDNKVLEGKTLDYKQKLPSDSEKDKKEFLADVSSFANASGGDLVIGVSESKGIITAVGGLEVDDIDKEISRLESLIRTGIEPRTPSYRIQPVELKNSKYVLIIRVRQSWIGPHRVIFNKDYQFYSRNSNGKYPLDISEIRTAFDLSETITERIRKFREDRLAKIIANETPVPIGDNAKIVLHLIPITSFNLAQSVDIEKAFSSDIGFTPISCKVANRHYEKRYNFDGIVFHSYQHDASPCSYAQLYRNGTIEAVDGIILRPRGHELRIRRKLYEKALIESLNDYISELKSLEVEPPIIIFLTLLEVKGYFMDVYSDPDIDEIHRIDRDNLLLPEVIMESYDLAPEKILKPCFDAVWNACGFPRDLYYNDAGEWAPPR